MKRTVSILLAVLMVMAFSTAAFATVLFQDLGTAAPPATLGAYTMTPFDQVPQAAIVTFTDVTTIPGSPVPDLTTDIAVNKRAIGDGWATWSHGYTGVVYFSNGSDTVTFTLPPNAGAFYLYVESNSFSTFNFTVTTNNGTTSGAIPVLGDGGANGFGFYTTANEIITSITVTTEAGAGGFSAGEFAYAEQLFLSSVPTINEWGMIIFMVLAGLGAAYMLPGRRSES